MLTLFQQVLDSDALQERLDSLAEKAVNPPSWPDTPLNPKLSPHARFKVFYTWRPSETPTEICEHVASLAPSLCLLSSIKQPLCHSFCRPSWHSVYQTTGPLAMLAGDYHTAALCFSALSDQVYQDDQWQHGLQNAVYAAFALEQTGQTEKALEYYNRVRPGYIHDPFLFVSRAGLYRVSPAPFDKAFLGDGAGWIIKINELISSSKPSFTEEDLGYLRDQIIENGVAKGDQNSAMHAVMLALKENSQLSLEAVQSVYHAASRQSPEEASESTSKMIP